VKPVVPAPSSSRYSLESLAEPGVHSLKALWKPFVLIQLCGLSVVVAYFTVPSAKAFCDVLGQFKVTGGLLVAAAMMAFACGVLPEVFKFVAGVDRSFTIARGRTMLFHMALFSVSGIVADVYYNFVNARFAGVSPLIAVPAKVFIDQLLFSTLVGLPLLAIGFTLWESGLSFYKQLGIDWYVRRVVTLLLPCWAYWFPMCFLMYALPGSLTFTFGAIASAASATVLTATATRAGRVNAADGRRSAAEDALVSSID
jgi:hypothetical protein